MSPFLSIIIPAYNEAKRLPRTLSAVAEWLRTKRFSYEILVVNDGSRDTTTAYVEEMARAVPSLQLLDNVQNRGKGAVVRQGMLAAKGEIRLFMDADNSTSVDHLDRILPLFKKKNRKYDVVIASRAIPGALLDPPQPFYRQLAGKGLNLFAQMLLLPGIWDTQCGFKTFTAPAAEAIFSRAEINGWAFDVEILALARALGLHIGQVPAYWKNDAATHVPLSAGLRFIAEAITIRVRLWTDTYHIRAEHTSLSCPSNITSPKGDTKS